MPTNDGRFRGQGWSQAKEDAWTRIFGPALADDPAYEDAATQECCGAWANDLSCSPECLVPHLKERHAREAALYDRLSDVPGEPPDEVSVGEHAARLYDDLAVEELQREIEELR